MKMPSFLTRPLLLLIALLAPAVPAWSNVAGVSLTSPNTNDVCRNTITLTYTLGSQAPVPGGTYVTFSQEHATYGYSFTAPAGTAGPHSFTFDPTQPELSPELITAGQPHIPGGVYDVRLWGYDAGGQQQVSLQRNVTISYAQPPARPSVLTHELRYVKGGTVPLELTDSNVQEGALWTGFGSPAVNENGQIAFIGKWHAPASSGTPTAQSGIGLWLDNQLLFFVGGPVPEMAGLVFKSFKDPVIDRFGRVAFIAAIKGQDVTSANDTVIISNVGGLFHIVAREGDPSFDTTDSAPYKSFTSVAIKADPDSAPQAGGGSVVPGKGGIYFTAKLGSPAGSTNDEGAWWQPSGSYRIQLMIRKGFQLPDVSIGVDTVKSFQLLKALSGSPAQGRGPCSGHQTLLQITFATGGFQVIARVTGSGASPIFESVIQTGGAVDGILPGTAWKKLGSLPSVSDDGLNISLLASITETDKSVSKGIFQTNDGGAAAGGATWTYVATTGGGTFGAFKDPVVAADRSAVAFLGANTLGNPFTKFNNDAIYSQAEFASGNLVEVAREGSQPPGAPAGAQWKSFSSLLQPGGGGGPIFTAQLVKGLAGASGPGGITSIDDFALYGTSTEGDVLELLRENQPLGSTGRIVKSFTVLKASSGSPGVQRNAGGSTVVALANFVDKTSGIVVISIP